ncbi:hypothetical protein COB57_01070 [Candidatus Peregrinibacteria bacterium]|nr:MAG: hypothetical protein COB57_01070 [Candidatus Peregrinibacteria bacterium]
MNVHEQLHEQNTIFTLSPEEDKYEILQSPGEINRQSPLFKAHFETFPGNITAYSLAIAMDALHNKEEITELSYRLRTPLTSNIQNLQISTKQASEQPKFQNETKTIFTLSSEGDKKHIELKIERKNKLHAWTIETIEKTMNDIKKIIDHTLQLSNVSSDTDVKSIFNTTLMPESFLTKRIKESQELFNLTDHKILKDIWDNTHNIIEESFYITPENEKKQNLSYKFINKTIEKLSSLIKLPIFKSRDEMRASLKPDLKDITFHTLGKNILPYDEVFEKVDSIAYTEDNKYSQFTLKDITAAVINTTKPGNIDFGLLAEIGAQGVAGCILSEETTDKNLLMTLNEIIIHEINEADIATLHSGDTIIMSGKNTKTQKNKRFGIMELYLKKDDTLIPLMTAEMTGSVFEREAL